MLEYVIDTTFSEKKFIGGLLQIFAPPSRLSTREWAETNRILTSDVTSRPGKMDCSETPWMLFVMKCFDNPDIRVIVGKKSAQIAWSETTLNYIGRTIDLDPRNIMIAFPRAASAQKFYKEKIVPLISNTDTLKKKIGNLTKVSHKHIPYPGGFMILANAGAADDGKSSVVPIILVEEPDGVKEDVNNQGDGMEILKQRMKTFHDSKLIYAGTPTDKDFSQVDKAYERSNQMTYQVPCHECGQHHALSFDNLKYQVFNDRKIDEIYGAYDPETAYYECPHCYASWTDAQKKINVTKAIETNWIPELEAIGESSYGWKPSKPEVTDVYGFAFKELLSSFEASSLVNLAKQKLRAEKDYVHGKEGLMKSFTNNSDGEAYAPKNTNISVEDLKKQRLSYPEGIVPFEGLVLTAGVDVQHNRFAIAIRAWGRNGNSYLVLWEEIFGDVLDYDDPVWGKLEELLVNKFPHAVDVNKKYLQIEAAGIDSADGGTSELVYRFVTEMGRKYRNNLVFALKGVADMKYSSLEIYNEPATFDINSFSQERRSIAQTMGVTVYPVGAYKAHKEVLRRFNLKGNRDRHYHCETSYGNYEEQILSCRENFAGHTVQGAFKLIGGKRKEAIDCEKMALWASYAIGIRTWTEKQWKMVEEYVYRTVN